MSFDAPLTPYSASDSHAAYLNVSCLDLLLIEMVPLAARMARRAERVERGELLGVEGAGEEDAGGGGAARLGGKGKKEGKMVDDVAGGAGGVDMEVYRDAMFFRLDGLGYRVGQGLSERYVRIYSLWRVERVRFGRGILHHHSDVMVTAVPLELDLLISLRGKIGHAVKKKGILGHNLYHPGAPNQSPAITTKKQGRARK